MKKIIPILLISSSAALWGIIAIFVRKLSDLGFSPMEIVTVRVVTAAVLLGILGMSKYSSQMKINPLDIRLFIGTGICSIVLFNWCYFSAINQMSLSIAVILLYTAPVFVTALSFFLLKEKMDKVKLLAVLGTIVGCVLVVGVNFYAATSISFLGILTGLGAGFGYALYTIFGKFALRKYQPFTVTFYTFVIASLTLLPLTGLWKKGHLLLNSEVLIYGIGLGLFPTVMAYLFYTKGLEKIDSSKAAIIATVEPVVATILSVFLYREEFGVTQGIGTLFILLSVLLISRSKNSFNEKYAEKASIN